MTTGTTIGDREDSSTTHGNTTATYNTVTDAVSMAIADKFKGGNITIENAADSDPSTVAISSTGDLNTVGTVKLKGENSSLKLCA